MDLHSGSFLKNRSAGCSGIRGQEDSQLRACCPDVVHVKADLYPAIGVVGEVFGVLRMHCLSSGPPFRN